MELLAQGKSLWNTEVTGEPLIVDDDNILTPEQCRGKILVAHIPSPDIVLLMREALAIVTETGGVLCHAAVLALELGCPIIVAATGVQRVITDKKSVFLLCANGEGYVYA